MKHTPNWRLDRRIHGAHAWITGDGQEQSFAKFYLGQPHHRKHDPELVANFHLALAAPKLYELAKLVAAGNTEVERLEEIALGLLNEIEGGA